LFEYSPPILEVFEYSHFNQILFSLFEVFVITFKLLFTLFDTFSLQCKLKNTFKTSNKLNKNKIKD